MRTTGKQCGLAATGDYQPSLRSPWLAADVIGQVRIDTRLYDEPPKRKKGQRGRPRKYGRKYTPKRIA
ncbi:hypothetical protein, partial [Thiolapillus sp.]